MKSIAWLTLLTLGIVLRTPSAWGQHGSDHSPAPAHGGGTVHSAPGHAAPAPGAVQGHPGAHGPSAPGVATPGTVTLEFTTTTTGKPFAPRHVLAVWVTDDQGRFVRTLQCNANRYRRHLVQWTRNSETNLVDAVTSASLTEHTTHTVTWDCRNAAGQLVKDGRYRLRVEFTEANGAGPATPETLLQFTKGANAVSLKPLSQPHFTGLALAYKPASAP